MSPPPLRLLSSMATREPLALLAAAFQAGSGQAVVAEAAGGVEVARRIRAGEAVDVVALARDALDSLIRDGLLSAEGRIDFASCAIAIAVREAAPRPVIDTEDDLLRAVLAARSLAYSTGPSGRHLEATFARWGILDQVRSRIMVAPPGVPVATLIATGQAELGFQQQSELMNVPGIVVLGRLPDPVQQLTMFSAAISSRSTHAAAAALLQFLASPAATATIVRFGLQPPDDNNRC